MAMSCKPWRLVPIAAAMLLGACDTIHPNGSTDPGFGEAARYNAALQTIDPDPVAVAGAAMPGASGALGAAAAKRYRTDTVKHVVPMATTASSTGSGPN
jgi:hypothetical protein